MNNKKSNIFKSILLLVFAMVSAFLCIENTFATETKIKIMYQDFFMLIKIAVRAFHDMDKWHLGLLVMG